MNYLAHITLSGSNRQMQLGGFIADFVKGNQSKKYPENVWKGIVLHRKIDEFTDNHPLVLEAVKMLRPTFGRLSGIILDMYFDHFLAENYSKHTNGKKLHRFSVKFSLTALWYYKILPDRVKGFIFHFSLTNRLYKYKHIDGLYESLKIMSVYKVKMLEPDKCIRFLETNKVELYQLFILFFNDLVKFSDAER